MQLTASGCNSPLQPATVPLILTNQNLFSLGNVWCHGQQDDGGNALVSLKQHDHKNLKI